MNQVELASYRTVLESKLAELLEIVGDRQGIVIEKNADALDEVQHATERDLAISNLDRDSRLLRDVRAALDRIASGTLGTCLRCDEDISTKRLYAVPWTPYCITCQEWSDRHQEPQNEYLFELAPTTLAA